MSIDRLYTQQPRFQAAYSQLGQHASPMRLSHEGRAPDQADTFLDAGRTMESVYLLVAAE